ncbi:ArnT family glycosyltransferase [Rurimicrobium arvi]|uniref:ArnT family glycosyltransferase n=1 Tax=Rurimicrobium arvi TaxID=2049916 RepID=UPI0031CE9E82
MLIVIVLIALGLRLYMIQADPFLHDWDERFHALVARNMMDRPFYPVLYKNPVIPFDPSAWCCNQVWLHKQPLFLWQMALSMRIFCVSEWALRLPSAIMGTLSVLLVYRLSWLLTREKRAAVIAALIICCSCYQLGQISGREGMDHNDVAFCFYVLASFWAAAEYREKPVLSRALMIGVFAGAAVLNKWLTGLLVFLPLGICWLTDLCRRKSMKRIHTGHFFAALITGILVFLPWQLYIWHRFPTEARIEFDLNTRHLFSVVEGHEGDPGYYLSHFNQYFGDIIEILVVPALLLFSISRRVPSFAKVLLVAPVLFAFCFFSFVVQTKVTGFFFVAYPFVIVMIGLLLHELLRLVPGISQPLLYGLLCIALAYWSLNPQRICDQGHTRDREQKIRNAALYKSLHRLLPRDINVLCNVDLIDHANVMFYNPRLSAYNFCFNEEEMKSLVRKKVGVAILPDRPGYNIPDYVRRYPYVYMVPVSAYTP